MRNRSLVLVLMAAVAFSVPALAKDDKTEKAMPPGLQKNVEHGKELPKGWKKKLVKGTRLDAAVYTQSKKVTAKDDPKLPAAKAGEIWVRTNGVSIRIKEANHEILDVILPKDKK